MASATAVAATALAVAGASIGQLEVFGLLALAVVPWAAVLAWRSWPHYRYTLAAALSITLVAFALVVRWGQEHPESKSGTRPAGTGSLAAAAAHLRFLAPAEPIPHCVTFNGTGTIPRGDELVLFDHPSDYAGRYSATPQFGYDGPVDAKAGGWVAPDREIGSGDPSDNGTHIAIVALLVPENVKNFLNDLTQDSTTGQLPASALKLGAQADKIVTTRNNQNAHC